MNGCQICGCEPAWQTQPTGRIGAQKTVIKSKTRSDGGGRGVSEIITDSRGEDINIDSETWGSEGADAITRIRGRGGGTVRARNTGRDKDSLALQDIDWDQWDGGSTIIDTENEATGGGQSFDKIRSRNRGGLSRIRSRNKAFDGGIADNEIDDLNEGGEAWFDVENRADEGGDALSRIRGRTHRGGRTDGIFRGRATRNQRSTNDLAWEAVGGEDVEVDIDTRDGSEKVRHNWDERRWTRASNDWGRRKTRRPRGRPNNRGRPSNRAARRPRGRVGGMSSMTSTDGMSGIISYKNCYEPKAPGSCMAWIPRYYYSHITMKCEFFVYGGCGGNNNNYESLDDCQWTCERTAYASGLGGVGAYATPYGGIGGMRTKIRSSSQARGAGATSENEIVNETLDGGSADIFNELRSNGGNAMSKIEGVTSGRGSESIINAGTTARERGLADSFINFNTRGGALTNIETDTLAEEGADALERINADTRWSGGGNDFDQGNDFNQRSQGTDFDQGNDFNQGSQGTDFDQGFGRTPRNPSGRIGRDSGRSESVIRSKTHGKGPDGSATSEINSEVNDGGSGFINSHTFGDRGVAESVITDRVTGAGSGSNIRASTKGVNGGRGTSNIDTLTENGGFTDVESDTVGEDGAEAIENIKNIVRGDGTGPRPQRETRPVQPNPRNPTIRNPGRDTSPVQQNPRNPNPVQPNPRNPTVLNPGRTPPRVTRPTRIRPRRTRPSREERELENDRWWCQRLTPADTWWIRRGCDRFTGNVAQAPVRPTRTPSTDRPRPPRTTGSSGRRAKTVIRSKTTGSSGGQGFSEITTRNEGGDTNIDNVTDGSNGGTAKSVINDVNKGGTSKINANTRADGEDSYADSDLDFETFDDGYTDAELDTVAEGGAEAREKVNSVVGGMSQMAAPQYPTYWWQQAPALQDAPTCPGSSFFGAGCQSCPRRMCPAGQCAMQKGWGAACCLYECVSMPYYG